MACYQMLDQYPSFLWCPVYRSFEMEGGGGLPVLVLRYLILNYHLLTLPFHAIQTVTVPAAQLHVSYLTLVF